MKNQELLSKINDITIQEKFPFQLIDGSCFYFGSAFDGDCMWYCNDSYERYGVDSYVYCDYGDTNEINLETSVFSLLWGKVLLLIQNFTGIRNVQLKFFAN